MILVTIVPLRPYAGMLSIPRDLFVTLPDGSQNRINTAHFFAEAQELGTGPLAALATVEQNFGVHVDYYARVRFDGIVAIAEAMGGLDIFLERQIADLPVGQVHLEPGQVLVLVRDRSGTDDFARMRNGQLVLKAMLTQMARPSSWPRLPGVMRAALASIDTNVPVWLWPRLGFALLRAGPDGIDSRTIDRSMVTSYQTDLGAQVLLPDWQAINPVLFEMFGE
jgi:LCP family protein required for cell wall assembly